MYLQSSQGHCWFSYNLYNPNPKMLLGYQFIVCICILSLVVSITTTRNLNYQTKFQVNVIIAKKNLYISEKSPFVYQFKAYEKIRRVGGGRGRQIQKKRKKSDK